MAIVSSREGLKLDLKDLRNEKLSMENITKMCKFLSWGGEEVSVKFVGKNILPLILTGQFIVTGEEGLFGEMANVAEALSDMQVRAGFDETSHSLNDLWLNLRELSLWTSILNAGDMQLASNVEVTTRPELSIRGICRLL